MKGDLRPVNQILYQDSEAAMANVIITSDQQYTALDVAVIVGQDEMVENLVYHIPEEDCHLFLHKALKVALKGGKIRIVKAILDRNSALENSLSTTSLTSFKSATLENELHWYLVKLIQSPPSYDAMRTLFLLPFG
ncbi:hypothetical protein ACJRO7_003031 [Eucalyptus globulus]|uniref:Uncharacterized protein n=1 Tax=Eucalyptus globulus TaxID=34317 RepID=A0ABD3IUJ8_EUCGL